MYNAVLIDNCRNWITLAAMEQLVKFGYLILQVWLSAICPNYLKKEGLWIAAVISRETGNLKGAESDFPQAAVMGWLGFPCLQNKGRMLK